MKDIHYGIRKWDHFVPPKTAFTFCHEDLLDMVFDVPSVGFQSPSCEIEEIISPKEGKNREAFKSSRTVQSRALCIQFTSNSFFQCFSAPVLGFDSVADLDKM